MRQTNQKIIEHVSNIIKIFELSNKANKSLNDENALLLSIKQILPLLNTCVKWVCFFWFKKLSSKKELLIKFTRFNSVKDGSFSLGNKREPDMSLLTFVKFLFLVFILAR